MKSEIALIYAPPGNTNVQKMKVALIRMGARVKMVTDDMLTMTIGEILDLSEEELKGYQLGKHDIQLSDAKETELTKHLEPSEIKEIVLVMYQFSSGQIDVMLQGFRKSKLPKINLKAVVTKHNVQWTFERLVAELRKEHEAYQRNNIQ